MSTQAAMEFLKNADAEFATKVADSDDAVGLIVDAGKGQFTADEVRAACTELRGLLTDAELDHVAGGVPAAAPVGERVLPGTGPIGFPGTGPIGVVAQIIKQVGTTGP